MPSWNAPREAFQHATYTDDVRDVLAHVYNKMLKEEDGSEWGEVNELKYLFRPSQPWTRQQALNFFDAALELHRLQTSIFTRNALLCFYLGICCLLHWYVISKREDC